jgi:hypothetical protein
VTITTVSQAAGITKPVEAGVQNAFRQCQACRVVAIVLYMSATVVICMQQWCETSALSGMEITLIFTRGNRTQLLPVVLQCG